MPLETDGPEGFTEERWNVGLEEWVGVHERWCETQLQDAELLPGWRGSVVEC